MNPLGVSVVIPAFNAGAYIGEAIQSVLRQAVPPIEVIVVDDGSTDETRAVVETFAGVTVISRANGGIGAARNTGIEEAHAPFLAFLDADDVWPDGRLQALLAAMEANPGAEAAFGQTIQFGEGRDDSAPQPGHLASGMLIRREAFDRVGRFNETLKVGEFIDWWARAQEAGIRSVAIPDVVLRRRIHTTNTGILQADSRVDYTRALRAALERRRGG